MDSAFKYSREHVQAFLREIRESYRSEQARREFEARYEHLWKE